MNERIQERFDTPTRARTPLLFISFTVCGPETVLTHDAAGFRGKSALAYQVLGTLHLSTDGLCYIPRATTKI